MLFKKKSVVLRKQIHVITPLDLFAYYTFEDELQERLHNVPSV